MRRRVRMKYILHNQRGVVLILFCLSFVGLFGFAALGMEVGRWYLTRAELSKAVDAAAMAGAKNISNPYAPIETIVQDVGKENFPLGYLGSPSSGEGSVSFVSQVLPGNKVKVTGAVSTYAVLARFFGIEQVSTGSEGVAQKNEVEIMMVLDKSGSMAGKPISDLKRAAKSFLQFFEETQDQDKMGLISFATGVRVDQPLGTNFVQGMTNKINALSAESGKRQFTNAEDAIDRSDDEAAGGFTDQTGLPGDRRKHQYLVFFTDGNPNAFRGEFTYNGVTYDAVAYVEGANGSCTGDVCGSDRYLCDPVTGNSLGIKALPTGDGKQGHSSKCSASLRPNAKWDVFSQYPVPGYSADYCNIPESALRPTWFKNVTRSMAIDHAQELKNKDIEIFIIGLGDVDKDFLGQIASGPNYEYYTPTSDDLEALFQQIAKEIKLRLVA
jgi:Flp pilus assembly protein TadG